ncbi:phosphatase PAP2 family protein [Metabacillus fastidiosus]|uniref:phosphatase PAP2 family protein n=1 Tax=Metabacillus fastidiosus TaxID=1458 RepID=UPI002DBAC093|nr:phosphatase PAP2 family protein [Metabacillus fastidiosus]MEC2078653.1 phosphatase PAP2 family protein [Metabacillus fastidiosus]
MKKVYTLVLLLIILFALIFTVHTETIAAMDETTGNMFEAINQETILTVLSFIGLLGSTKGIIIFLVLFIIIFAFLYKSSWQPLTIFIAVFLANVCNKLLKGIVERERPVVPGHEVDGFSFPSGHAMVGIVLYGLIACFIANKIQSKTGKMIVFIIAGIILLLIGISRLTAGEHYFTDIIGGFTAGGILLIVLQSGYSFLMNKRKYD